MSQTILYTTEAQALQKTPLFENYDAVFLLTEATVAQHCLPRFDAGKFRHIITLQPGDDNKDIKQVATVWDALQSHGATRHSLLVNLGGGMLTDLGGFAAATFKRGMNFINIPTTLLAMVDAAVGGKTGINYNGLKNEIGAFREAEAVVVDTSFLATLDAENLCAGYAEMLKHALLSKPDIWARHLNFELSSPKLDVLQDLVRENIELKSNIVNQDPTEKGIRKALNLGHTIGHALETKALQDDAPGLHGYFVAWGLIAELYLSACLLGFPTDQLRQTVGFIRAHYGAPNLTCHDYDRLYALMQHDKKNNGEKISFTLLSGIGEIHIDQFPTQKDIYEALDFLREA